MTILRIEVDTDSKGKRAIVVRDNDGIGSPNAPVEVASRAQMTWKAKDSQEVFRVFFFIEPDRSTAIWPFDTPPDGRAEHKGLAGIPYLNVGFAPPNVRRLAFSGPLSLKYDVVAVKPAGVAPLDPVIIIKPPEFTWAVRLTYGLIGAVLGALAGAALTWAFCR